MTKIGKVPSDFEIFKLKDVLLKNDAGDWGDESVGGGGVGVIRSTNFTNNGIFDLSDVAYRSLKPTKYVEKRVCENEILIEKIWG